ncbi:molybdenum cofactor biosynthesis protein MoaE [Mesoterricola sediminis]|nr:molybdenum cofactor biosynthesis protein MoaE [Mesoterricola sediminis]
MWNPSTRRCRPRTSKTSVGCTRISCDFFIFSLGFEPDYHGVPRGLFLVSMIEVTETRLDVDEIRNSMRDPRAGAVTVFEGCARDHHGGRAVSSLAYEAFGPMARAELTRIREAAMARFDLLGCAIHHRTGEVPLTEAAVVVACAAAHRGPTFEAVAWIMDRVKESVPVWKKEAYRDGDAAWVEGEARRP